MRHEDLIEEYSALTRGDPDLKREIFMIRIEYQVKEAVIVLNLPDSTVAMCLRAIADTYDAPKEKES